MLKSNNWGQWNVNYFYCQKLNLFSPTQHCNDCRECLLFLPRQDCYQENCWLPLLKNQEEKFLFTLDLGKNWYSWEKTNVGSL